MDPYLIKHVAVPQAIAFAVMSGVIVYAHYKAATIDRDITEGERKIAQDEHKMKNWYRNLPLRMQ